jgi:predicted membrane chloride channel (bestrophin family)
MTITLSPVSICGVNVGLFLPLRTAATCEDRRPNVYWEASTTYHFLSIVDGLAIKLFIGFPPDNNEKYNCFYDEM